MPPRKAVIGCNLFIRLDVSQTNSETISKITIMVTNVIGKLNSGLHGIPVIGSASERVISGSIACGGNMPITLPII